MMKVLTSTPVLATKRLKKIKVDVNCDSLLLIGIDFRPNFATINDLKSELINHGWKINWDIFDELLSLGIYTK